MVSTYVSYQNIVRDMPKTLARVQKEPQVERESDYYLANITKVKSIDDFMKNDRLYRYAMKSAGLEDMTYAKAFMRKVLEGGVSDKDSFANKLNDKRYADFAKTFDFKQFADTATVFTRAQQGTVDNYVRQTLEENAGNDNEGVRLALYFQRKIGAVTDFYGVLADKGLAKVVRTALGLPDSFATSDIDKQVKLFKSKINLDDLKSTTDPTALTKFLARFTAMYEIDNPTASTASPVTVLMSQPAELGISSDLMMTLQGLKLGGA